MKKIILLLAVMLVAVIVTNAQPGGNFDPAERIQRQVDQLTEACGLTQDQVPKVEAIIKEANEKMMEMFQGGGGGGDREAMRETMQENRDEQTKAIKALLNEDQAKKYDAYLEEEAERRANRGGFGG